MTAPLVLPGESRQAGSFHAWPLAIGLCLLALIWLGPLPERAQGSFAAHMVMHMGVVAIAAPLLALGLLRLWPSLASRIPPAMALLASFFEFLVVWSWHAPALHDAARVEWPLLLLEQTSFLAAGLLVWTSAIGSARSASGLAGRAAGVVALLVTSMHMTLLGALLLLSPRPLYACAALCSPAASLTPIEDQQLGGVLMLIVGGLTYLAGGLALLHSILRSGGEAATPEGAPSWR